MLRILNNKDLEEIKNLSSGSVLGTRIYCYALCYGFDKSFLDFWAGKHVLVVRFENTFTVMADSNADFAELREFLNIIGANEIVTEERTAKSMGFFDFSSKKAYRFSDFDSELYEEVSELDSSMIPDLYDIISGSIPDSFANDRDSRLSFLSDYMYRKNRGFSRAFGVVVDGNLVSTAITSSETDSSAIISGVACSELYRKSGYGKKTVLSIASMLSKENKSVYVIALNESAEGFYEHIGFQHCETISYISKKV